MIDTNVMDDLLTKANKQITHPITKVYIDLLYFQDFYLGAMLLNCKDADKYAYLCKQMNDYNSRVTLSHSSMFPDLQMDDQTLLTGRTFGSGCSELLKVSPVTDIYLNFPKLHANIISHNEKVMSLGQDPTKIIYLINTYPLTFSTADATRLKVKIHDIHPNITLGLISKKLDTVASSTLSNVNIFFINDLGNLIDPKTPLGDSFLNKLSFADKVVYSPMRIGDPKVLEEYPKLTQEEINKLFFDTELVACLYCDFHYLNPTILTE